MRFLLVLFWCCAASGQGTGLTVVSAANFRPVVAPESFVSIFGSQLATGSESGMPGVDGVLPDQLLSTTVEFEGTRAQLSFVSPGQINCVVPKSAPLGAVEVLVRNASTGISSRGTVRIARAAPALFSAGANGEGAGAILNGITFASAPFQAETEENGGSDKRTRLAVYGTGIRGALQVQAQARTPLGELLTLPVEYAGAAPVYPGLDQVNLVLPAEADLEGDIVLSLVAGTTASNAVTIRMDPLSERRIRLVSIEMARASARPGESLNGLVRLNGRAPRGGIGVRLSSSDLAVRVPQVITVAAGEVSASFSIQVGAVLGSRQVTIAADYLGSTATSPLQVISSDTPRIVGLSLARGAVLGGGAGALTVRISANASLSGQVVFLSSSDPSIVRLPAQVVVPFGRSEVQVDFAAERVSAAQEVVLSASLGEDRREATLQVRPPLSAAWVPEAAVGGNPVRLSVALGEPSPAGTTVSLAVDDTSVVLPATVSVARGQDSTALNVNTPVVTARRVVTATATAIGQSVSAELAVLPRAVPGVDSIALSPEIVRGGAPANAVVRISEPAPVGGAVVNLAADDVFAVRVPGFVIVPSGSTSANFNLQTFAVSSTRRVSISATWNGVRKSAVLTVN